MEQKEVDISRHQIIYLQHILFRKTVFFACEMSRKIKGPKGARHYPKVVLSLIVSPGVPLELEESGQAIQARKRYHFYS